MLPNATYIPRVMDAGFLTEAPGVRATNTGHAMLNLAYHSRPRQIVLLGYDMKRNGHWHGMKPGGILSAMPAEAYESWALDFNEAAPVLQAAGIDVINCSMESGLSCFRKQRIETLLTLSELVNR